MTAYLRVGSKFGLRGRWMLEAGITEGIRHQEAITDFGSSRPSRAGSRRAAATIGVCGCRP
jgi:hypothetical protein